MDIKTFYLSIPVEERHLFAERCGTTEKFLRNVAYGRTPGEKLCIAIERESRGAVRCEELRSDVDWAYLRGTARKRASDKVAA